MMVRFAIAGFVLLGSAVLASAATPQCLRLDDIEAEQAIHFQAELMVVSDTCGAQSYQHFTRRNRDALVAYQHVVIDRFRRDGVAHAEQRFDSYLTRLANEVSLRTGAQPLATLCREQAGFLATADHFDQQDFRRYIAQRAEQHSADYRRCRK